jgi:hypothetical protein
MIIILSALVSLGIVTLLNEERKKAAGRKIVRRPPHVKYLSPRRGSLGA